MRKVVKVVILFALLLVIGTQAVKAATIDEVITKVKDNSYIPSARKVEAERYLNKYEDIITASEADTIITKIDEGTAVMVENNQTDYLKLPKAAKEKLLEIGKQAATAAHATLVYEAASDTVTIYGPNNEMVMKLNTKTGLVQTGAENPNTATIVFGVVAGIAVIATVVAIKKYSR